MWAEILDKFLDLVIRGEFEDETEVIQYISENCLIDVLLVSVLKHSLPIENEDNDLNIGDWKNEDIDHRALFQGLCNEFDLVFQEDKENSIFRMYINGFPTSNSLSESVSEEMLLESRSKEKDKEKGNAKEEKEEKEVKEGENGENNEEIKEEDKEKDKDQERE
jgi:hypothetical protein